MKKIQRAIGWTLVGMGVVSVFVGASPMFHAVIEPLIAGGVLFVAGAWVLAGKELRDSVRRGIRVTRDSRLAQRRPSLRGPGITIDPLLPVRILKLAKEHGGVLTVAQVAMELNVPLEQARAGIGECVQAGNALPDYDIPRGHELYRFPELTPDETDRHSADSSSR
jgi:hypothetical protein